MAFTSNAVGRIRAAGSNLNGAFFDASISGAGTDYSQQDAAQLALIDCASTASTTITSVTGGFTAVMIGNAIRLSSGTGVTVGFYFITAVTDTNTITVDRASGTYTAGVGKVGGAAATLAQLINSVAAAGNKCVAGNTIYVRGAGTDNPGTADYTNTGYIQPVAGTQSAHVRILGEYGRPRFNVDGLFLYRYNYTDIHNLYIVATSNSNGTLGILFDSENTIGSSIRNCYISLGNQTGLLGVCLAGTEFIDNEIYGGTSSPTLSAGCYGITLGSSADCSKIVGNHIHHCRDSGIYINNSTAAGGAIGENVIRANAGDGITCNPTATFVGTIDGNVIDGNAGHGVNFATVASFVSTSIFNNLITNHVGVGKVALNIGAGTTASNDLLRQLVDYNGFYGNTTDYTNISAGDNDVVCSADPYTAVGTDFTLNNTAGGGANCRDAGFPQSPPGLSTTAIYKSIGFLATPIAGGGVTSSTHIYGLEGVLYG